MLNQYPLWKYLLVIAVVVPGFFYALPNIYGNDPGLQIRGTRTITVDATVLDQIETALKSGGVTLKSASLEQANIKLRFANTEDQLKAQALLQAELDSRKYTMAMSLLPSTPAWMDAINAAPMYLGLDLRGGVHFLMEVDLETPVKRAEDQFVADMRKHLRTGKARHQGVRKASTGGIEIRFVSEEMREKGRSIIFKEMTELDVADFEREGKPYLLATIKDVEKKDLTKNALEKNMTALRNRVDELGVAEPIVQRQGENRIVVQLPGVQDTAKAKTILGRTATLEVMLVDEKHDLQGALAGAVPPGSKIFYFRDGRPILIKNRVIYSGVCMDHAAASIDTQSGGPIVRISLNSYCGDINQRVTGENINNRMAVLYVEDRQENKLDANGNPVIGKDGKVVRVKKRIEEVITAPVIRDQLGRSFQIEGIGSVDEARDLALLLRAGAFATPVEIVEERTVGPSLGKENIDKGFRSVIIGFVLVLIFMFVYYRIFGLVADLALALNLVLIVAVLSFFQATLTLPGVAGIVLTVGMAVDANVLIFERIREELQNRNTPQASIHVGYDKALSTIVDANITTLIAAIVLFNFGTGPIKGFAITLSIGILTSMFTAIVGTRAVINLIYGGKRVEKLSI
ncbi:protein translocase subunit SecD [Pseudomonadota bacterium]